MLGKEEIGQIIKNCAKIYPNSKGLMLTGSQLNNEKINEHHDIDIIIFGTQFSVVSPFTLTIDNVKYDFTQFPYTDIFNTLLNEFADPRGTLLSMIVKATILKDSDTEILHTVQVIAKQYYEQINPANYEDFRASLKELIKIRKDMDRINDNHRRFFLITEFATLISSAELIKLSKWNNLGKHKADFLKEFNPRFIDKVSALVEYSIVNNTSSALTRIGTFIDYYLSLPNKLHHPSLIKKRLIIDFNYNELSYESFILDLLPLLQNDEKLWGSYKYFYLSPANYKRIYKRVLSIVFEIEEDEENFVKQFKDLILQVKTNVNTSLLPGYYQVYKHSQPFDLFLEPILIKTSNMVRQSVHMNRIYDGNRMIFTTIIIMSSLISIMGLTEAEGLNVCKYLLNRYLFTRREQDQIGNPIKYNGTLKSKYSALNVFIATHIDVIKPCFEKGVEYENIEKERLYFPVIEAIREATERYKEDKNNRFDDNNLTGKILFNDYGISQFNEGVTACTIYENIIQGLLLSPSQSACALFSVMRLIANKQDVRQKSIEVPL
ncbi:hypothetical protein [Mucilaginibacter sp. L196]|uniref:hypothetical protein n=1 Tax=Mucilaginibacter sp. L196 TaxID=1641870 RepID=UPI00131B289C|nr:hypothetical protein [Mucilaginibacter sp. L196]